MFMYFVIGRIGAVTLHINYGPIRNMSVGYVRIWAGERKMIRGCSSVERASVLQAEGREFDSHHLHQLSSEERFNSAGSV